MFSVVQTVQKADGFCLGGAFRLYCPPVLSCRSHYISGCCMFLPFPLMCFIWFSFEQCPVNGFCHFLHSLWKRKGCAGPCRRQNDLNLSARWVAVLNPLLLGYKVPPPGVRQVVAVASSIQFTLCLARVSLCKWFVSSGHHGWWWDSSSHLHSCSCTHFSL